MPGRGDRSSDRKGALADQKNKIVPKPNPGYQTEVIGEAL